MSNILKLKTPIFSVPAVSSGTVPTASRFVFGSTSPAGLSAGQFISTDNQLIERLGGWFGFKVTDSTGLATVVATVEGSIDGATWYGLQFDNRLPTGFTVDDKGIACAVAIAAVGVVLPIPAGFPFYRVGLAGNAASGKAEVGLRLAKGARLV